MRKNNQTHTQGDTEGVYFCGVSYSEEYFSIPEVSEEHAAPLKRLDERVHIMEMEQVELISVPVPDFSDSSPAQIVHDFIFVRSYTHTRLILVEH